jgi:mRNA interferase MazF
MGRGGLNIASTNARLARALRARTSPHEQSGLLAAARSRSRVALITSTIRGIPVEVPVGPANGLEYESVVSTDELQTIRLDRLVERIGDLDTQQRARLDAALRFALGLLA